MAFVFTVEDGTNVASANSYLTVAFADDYLSINTRTDTIWGGLTTQQKEKALARATLYLDANVNWKGTRQYKDSALRWPRTGMADADGNDLAGGFIPEEIKRAVAEVAYAMQVEDIDRIRTQDRVSELVVDTIEIVFDENRPRSTFPPIVYNLLKPFGILQGHGSSSFGRIVK